MNDRFKSDRRLDPRQVPILEGIDMVISKFGDGVAGGRRGG